MNFFNDKKTKMLHIWKQNETSKELKRNEDVNNISMFSNARLSNLDQSLCYSIPTQNKESTKLQYHAYILESAEEEELARQ